MKEINTFLRQWLWVVVIPPKDEMSNATRIIMPNKMKLVFEYFYWKEWQPTYSQASKDLGLVPSVIYTQIKNMWKLWILKTDGRWIITWTISDFFNS